MSKRAAKQGGFSPSGKAFLGCVIGAGLVTIVQSVYRFHIEPIDPQWYLLAALTLISGSTTVKLPSIPATISVSETFVFASVLLFGGNAGTITVALDGLVISFWMAKRRPEWYRALFNTAAPAVSIWCASEVLYSFPGVQPLIRQPASVNTLIVPLALFTVVYFGLNSGLITLAIAFETGISRYKIWRENFQWVSLNYFCGASVALLLVVYTREVDIRFIGVIVPLLLVLYFTFKTSMQRVEDANNHVMEVNRLYLSTIETLAMAIDAKDQITHGHIRRVQRFAVGLARKLEVNDEKLIKAIEAAALLHDTGKLAVPEYILNKPGKLSVAEFEKMKLHVTVGADILEAIDFPYPVVPIVRTHHENWDGTGYPAGIRGTDIPIGARILSVVDCFDALTSDRPYRPRLPNEEAMSILFQRRGSMYDPLVVDTFARVFSEIAADIQLDEPAAPMRQSNMNRTATPLSLAPTREKQTKDLGTNVESSEEFICSIAKCISIAAVCDSVADYVQQTIRHDLFVFYCYNPGLDILEASHAIGNRSALARGLKIELGQRVSGWVAANLSSIANSDPVLDLGEEANLPSSPLRSALSTPVQFNDELVGVVTLYSANLAAFGDYECRFIEAVAKQAAADLRRTKGPEQLGRPSLGAAVRARRA